VTTRHPDATGLPASRSGFGRSVRLAVSVGLLLVLFALADLDNLRQVMLAVRPDLLALMAAGMVAERLFAAYRWLLLLRLAEPGIAYWPVALTFRVDTPWTYISASAATSAFSDRW
jgi:hypothetical protein